MKQNNLSKHFQILNEYEFLDSKESQNKFFQEIEELENMILKKDVKYFGNQLRQNLEILFFDSFGYEGLLKQKIDKFIDKFFCPTNVWGSLNYLKSITNRESHASVMTKTDKHFKMILSISEAIVSLKSLFILIKFILMKKYSDIEFEIMIFDDSIYEAEENLSNKINTQLENPNNDLKPHIFSMAQLIMLEDYKFNIPTYQRAYTWTKDQTLKLLDDIKLRSQDNKTHYLGSIAVASDDENKILRIIDGQQRITTSLIILKAFYDEFKKAEYDVPEELEDLMMNKIHGIYINQKVLISQKEVEKLLNDNYLINTKTSKKSLAYTNYWLTRDFLSPYNKKELNNLYATFAQYFNAGVLVFKTTIDNEMDIFENLNTGGVKLSGWDLIKNYIFSRLEPTIFRENEETVNAYINHNLETPAFEVSSRGNSNKILDSFFMIYGRLGYATMRDEVLKLRKNHEAFKMIWPKVRGEKFTNYKDYIEEVNEVLMYFNIFKELQFGYKNNESKIHSFSHILDLIVKEDTLPLLIFGLKQCVTMDDKFKIQKINKKKFWRLLRAIECYFVRTDTYGDSQSKLWDKFLKQYKDSKMLGDDFFAYAQTEEMNPVMKPIDIFIENYSQNGDISTKIIKNICINAERKLRKITPSSGSYVAFEKTYEHILAQKLNFSDYGKEITEEDFKDNMLRWKNAIGNALILTRDLNASAGNKPFLDKLPIYKKSNSKLAEGSQSEIMNLFNKDIFTFEDIAERSKQLAKFTYNIYKEIGTF